MQEILTSTPTFRGNGPMLQNIGMTKRTPQPAVGGAPPPQVAVLGSPGGNGTLKAPPHAGTGRCLTALECDTLSLRPEKAIIFKP